MDLLGITLVVLTIGYFWLRLTSRNPERDLRAKMKLIEAKLELWPGGNEQGAKVTLIFGFEAETREWHYPFPVIFKSGIMETGSYMEFFKLMEEAGYGKKLSPKKGVEFESEVERRIEEAYAQALLSSQTSMAQTAAA